MNEMDTKRGSYYVISPSDLILHSDPDNPQWLCQGPSPDLVRQIDAVLEATGDTEAHHLLDQIIALEAYLNEPHALFSGEKDAEGIDVTEYPFA